MSVQTALLPSKPKLKPSHKATFFVWGKGSLRDIIPTAANRSTSKASLKNLMSNAAHNNRRGDGGSFAPHGSDDISDSNSGFEDDINDIITRSNELGNRDSRNIRSNSEFSDTVMSGYMCCGVSKSFKYSESMVFNRINQGYLRVPNDAIPVISSSRIDRMVEMQTNLDASSFSNQTVSSTSSITNLNEFSNLNISVTTVNNSINSLAPNYYSSFSSSQDRKSKCSTKVSFSPTTKHYPCQDEQILLQFQKYDDDECEIDRLDLSSSSKSPLIEGSYARSVKSNICSNTSFSYGCSRSIFSYHKIDPLASSDPVKCTNTSKNSSKYNRPRLVLSTGL